jgi:hypothetical protein
MRAMENLLVMRLVKWNAGDTADPFGDPPGGAGKSAGDGRARARTLRHALSAVSDIAQRDRADVFLDVG